MRLIDADKFAEKFTGQYEFMKRVIDEQPTVDAVEIVRCKDCIHYTSYCCHYHEADKDGMPIYMNKEDFCSYGERKE